MFDAAGAATAAAVASDSAAFDQADAKSAQADGNYDGDGAHNQTATDIGPFGSKAEAQFIDAENAAEASRREIVFVDARLPDIDKFVAPDGGEIVILDPSENGVAQVSAALAGRIDVDAIHFVGHGEGGQFTLGGTVIDAAALDIYGADIMAWSQSLTADADIMLRLPRALSKQHCRLRQRDWRIGVICWPRRALPVSATCG